MDGPPTISLPQKTNGTNVYYVFVVAVGGCCFDSGVFSEYPVRSVLLACRHYPCRVLRSSMDSPASPTPQYELRFCPKVSNSLCIRHKIGSRIVYAKREIEIEPYRTFSNLM